MAQKIYESHEELKNLKYKTIVVDDVGCVFETMLVGTLDGEEGYQWWTTAMEDPVPVEAIIPPAKRVHMDKDSKYTHGYVA